MLSPSDIQKWQTATNGINESGQKDLNQVEWSALIVLNGCLQSGNFQSEESLNALAFLKNNLSRHGSNQILQMHLQDFIALCDPYFQTNKQIIPPSVIPAIQPSVTATSNTVKTKGSNKNLILIIVALVVGYLVYSNWDAISGMSNGGLPNGRYEIANTIGSGSLLPDVIVISGNNFTTEWSLFRTSTTIKFKYRDGEITITDKGTSVSVPCEFKNGSLWYAGMEYKKVK